MELWVRDTYGWGKTGATVWTKKDTDISVKIWKHYLDFTRDMRSEDGGVETFIKSSLLHLQVRT